MTWRLFLYIVAHPMIARRWHTATNAPWPTAVTP